MVIFHSYVKLPKGNGVFHNCPPFFSIFPTVFKNMSAATWKRSLAGKFYQVSSVPLGKSSHPPGGFSMWQGQMDFR